MRILQKLNLILLVLLSLSTGLVKLFSMEAEMILFRKAGWGDWLIYLFGAVQLIGGMLLVSGRTRKSGAIIMFSTFVVATVVLFINNMVSFGCFSVLFILMALWPIVQPIRIIKAGS